MARLAFFTPTRIAVPAARVAAAFWATTTKDPNSVAVAVRFWNAKSPDSATKLATFACKPLTSTVATPASTATGTLTSTAPTRMESVSSRLRPVLL